MCLEPSAVGQLLWHYNNRNSGTGRDGPPDWPERENKSLSGLSLPLASEAYSQIKQ